MQQPQPDLIVEHHGHVAVIAINRPGRKNAFSLEVVEDIVDALTGLRRDDRCRAVILTGRGGAFCSGVDLAVVEDMEKRGESAPGDWKNLLTEKVHRIAYALESFDKPVIAAVDGPAYGAGMDLALMCDMRFVSTRVRFCEAYVNLGVVPGDGGCYYLPRIVGLPVALDLLLSGRVVEAEEARQIGLANRVCAPDELLEETRAFAEVLATKSPAAIQLIKRATYQSLDLDLRTSMDLISSHMALVRSLEDTAEVARALRDGDKPDFVGR